MTETLANPFLDAPEELEISGNALEATGELLTTTQVETIIAPSPAEEALLTLTAPVENSSLIASYLPFFEGYSDLQAGLMLFAGLIWVLTIIWVIRDAMARSESLAFQLFAALLVTLLSPVVGLPLYLAFRPLVYKWERGYWREAMTQGIVPCPHCGSLVDDQHKACVFCGEYLQAECKECQHTYYRGYRYCSQCGTPNLGE